MSAQDPLIAAIPHTPPPPLISLSPFLEISRGTTSRQHISLAIILLPFLLFVENSFFFFFVYAEDRVIND